MHSTMYNASSYTLPPTTNNVTDTSIRHSDNRNVGNTWKPDVERQGKVITYAHTHIYSTRYNQFHLLS